MSATNKDVSVPYYKNITSTITSYELIKSL